MAKKKNRRGKSLGTVYRHGQLQSIRMVVNGAKVYEHGFPVKIPHGASAR